GLVGITLTDPDLPDGVSLIDDDQFIRIQQPTNLIFTRLLDLAPESEYWKAVEHLYRESNKPLWGGFSSVSLTRLPAGAEIPTDIATHLRYDQSLANLIVYEPLSSNERDRLIDATRSAQWYRTIDQIRRDSKKATACFYGGGGFIFPRWFLQEFP